MSGPTRNVGRLAMPLPASAAVRSTSPLLEHRAEVICTATTSAPCMQLPAVHRRHVAVGEAAMVAQILRRLRRAVRARGMSGEATSARRAGARRRAMRLEIRQGADAHRDVDAFLERVDEAVVEHQLDAQLRVARHELGDRVAEIEDAERHRRVDLEDAARLVVQPRDLDFRLLDVGEDRHAALVIGEARLGRASRAASCGRAAGRRAAARAP